MDCCSCLRLIREVLRREIISPAYLNAVYNGGSQDVSPEEGVDFLSAYQSGDFVFTPNASVITVNTAGVYRIDYEVTLRPNQGSINTAYAVAINGLDNPLSFFGERFTSVNPNDRVQLNGFFIADIPAGATVELRNKSSTNDILAGTGIDNQTVNRASIILQRIA